MIKNKYMKNIHEMFLSVETMNVMFIVMYSYSFIFILLHIIFYINMTVPNILDSPISVESNIFDEKVFYSKLKPNYYTTPNIEVLKLPRYSMTHTILFTCFVSFLYCMHIFLLFSTFSFFSEIYCCESFL